MLNQFSRTQLLIGKEAMDRLSKTRVAIFGIGGVGGYTAEALARSGVGELDSERYKPCSAYKRLYLLYFER